MATPPEAFDDLIGAIADGDPLDWKKIEGSGRFRRGELAAAKAIAALRDTSEESAREWERPAQGFDRIAELGRGAFGRVWRARDRVLGREVALKVLESDAALTPAQRERYLREARALAACEHENIVRIHSVEEREGRVELCLELLDGRTLEQLVKEHGPLGAEEAARIGSDLCRALAALHSRGLLHRDVKPANVIRARGGRIVLLDFGLAHAADPSGCRSSIAGGTPLFMAPELLDRSTDFDARVDVYSLGVTLYWLVTGCWPYDATTREELLQRMKQEPPTPLLDRRPDLPRAFVALVERAMAHDRRDRFASAGAMEAALREIAEPRVRTNSWRVVALAAAACVVLAATFLCWQTWRSHVEIVYFPFDESGGTSVTFQATPLRAGHAFKRGDPVYATIHLNRPTYTYGFLFDEQDHCFSIYPSNESGLQKPLLAGTSRLPSTDAEGENPAWQLRGAPGAGRIEFYLSDEPSPQLETLWKTAPKLAYDKYYNDPPRGSDGSETKIAPADAAQIAAKAELMKLATDRSRRGVTVRGFDFDVAAR